MSTETPTIALIAAVADNAVIGQDGEMPWHLPADLTHFKETTMGHPVIMGRRTYESIEAAIGGPLPGRTNIVLSRSEPELPAEVVVVDAVDAAIVAAADVLDTGPLDTVYVIGGASVYEQFLPQADQLVLTELADSYDGDTRFPEWDRTEWHQHSRDDRDGFAFVEYRRQ